MRIQSIAYLSLVFLILNSCASKKEILYMQDVENLNGDAIVYGNTKIQPNDILKISVDALIQDSAIPYNRTTGQSGGVSLELLQLEGYLVSIDNTIDFPVLGTISTKNNTVIELQSILESELIKGGHLKNPSVNVRILNAKVTILGEVNSPGTYNFTEQNITLLQALGYAKDLTINGKREDVKVIREVNGNRKIATLNLTSSEFMNSEFYQIKPNDVIYVGQNNPRVKSAGFIGNVGTLLSVVSILFTTVVLITR